MLGVDVRCLHSVVCSVVTCALCFLCIMYAIAYWVTKYLLNCKQVTDILTASWAATDGWGTGVICVIWSHSGEWARYSSRVVGHSRSAYEGEREEGEWWLAGVHLIVTHGVDVLVSCVTEWHQTWYTAPSMYIPTHTPHSHPLPHSSSFCHSVSIDMQHHYLLFTGNTTSIHCR